MVRAAGLYPARSRFESWLPYQQDPRQLGAPISGQSSPRTMSMTSSRRSEVIVRDGGSEASQAGI